MGLFRKRPAETATAPRTAAESLETLIRSSGQPSLFAHSDFVKQVTCTRCGAPKQLPSKTAYLYCDHCGSLIDYDFRLANSGTSAGLTNTVYQLLDATGVLAMDPDEAPPGVALWMEYSTFCQGWIPHLLPADGERFLAIFGLTGQYARVTVTDAVTRSCGGCGDELKTLPGATAVICESCGRKLDIASGQTPCQTCGAPLSFPVGVSSLECPYCHSGTHRI
jgi:LSD1 subclass zinc finger protein